MVDQETYQMFYPFVTSKSSLSLSLEDVLHEHGDFKKLSLVSYKP